MNAYIHKLFTYFGLDRTMDTQIYKNKKTKKISEDHRVCCSLPFKREPLIRSLSLSLCFFEFQRFVFFFQG